MIGPHVIRAEEDVIFYAIHGPISLDDMRALVELGEAISARSGQYWLVADVRHMTTVHPDARRFAARNPRLSLFRGAAITGGSVVSRALILLIARAMSLLGSSHVQISFVATEAEARSWVAAKKAKRLYGS